MAFKTRAWAAPAAGTPNHGGMPRPFLTARWSNLILITYRVDPAVLKPRLPPGCRLDLAGGHALASLVAFDFLDCRVLGVRWPGFVNFPEVNLRFYVRYGEGDAERRGVVFVREFVTQWTIATLARLTYNEPYRSTRMRSDVTADGGGDGDGGMTVDHRLTVAGRERRIRLTADAAARPSTDAEAFLTEHQWGFGASHFGRLIRYQVVHEPWAVHPVRSFEVDWDWAAAYGPAFAGLQGAEPVSAVLAAGSAVSIFPRGDVAPVHPSRPAVAAPPSLSPPVHAPIQESTS